MQAVGTEIICDTCYLEHYDPRTNEFGFTHNEKNDYQKSKGKLIPFALPNATKERIKWNS